MLFGGRSPRAPRPRRSPSSPPRCPPRGSRRASPSPTGVDLVRRARADRPGRAPRATPGASSTRAAWPSTAPRPSRAAPCGAEDLLHGRWVLLRKGKKGWAARGCGRLTRARQVSRRRVDTLRTPPVGCPSAPRRPRQRRERHRKGHPGTTVSSEHDCRSSAHLLRWTTLLENRREDEKASAGVCPTLLGGSRSRSTRMNALETDSSICWLFLVPVGKERDPSTVPGSAGSSTPIEGPTASVAGSRSRWRV